MLQPLSARVDLKQLNKHIDLLERQLEADPNDLVCVQQICAILDYYVPDDSVSGRYTDCQRALAGERLSEASSGDLLGNELFIDKYNGWEDLLFERSINTGLPETQIFRGNNHTIKGVDTACDLRLRLFEEKDAISKLCFSCFKVQILLSSVIDLIRLNFLFRKEDFPSINARKCLIEIRKDVPYPYKGYIYTESEEDVSKYLRLIEQSLGVYNFDSVVCKITHGCSEYSIRFPEFKYSPDGSHREFKMPADWYSLEAQFFLDNPKNRVVRKGFNAEFVTLQEVLAIHTWIAYAKLIGDPTASRFSADSRYGKRDQFVQRIAEQSTLRMREIDELREMSAA